MRRRVWWIGVLLGWLVWTIGLLRPVPERAIEGVGGSERAFWLGKSLHIGMYAGLTWGILVAAGRRWTPLLLALAIVHAVSSEIGQSFVPGRTGRVEDVGLDCLGIALGFLIAGWTPPSAVSAGSASRQAIYDPSP